jgi:hypothetical protein
MALPNIFADALRGVLLESISILTEPSTPKQNKMNLFQRLAHLNVVPERALEQEQKRLNALISFLLTPSIRNKMIDERPYKKNNRTTLEILIKQPFDD